MRILFLESHPMWIYSVPNGFRDAGHDVRVSGTLSVSSIAELIEEFKPELIIMLGWTQEHSGLKRKSIRKLVQNAGVPLVYWATEDPIHTQVFSLPFAMQIHPDFIFTVTESLVDYYENKGFQAAYMDFAYHPSVHKLEAEDVKYKASIAVVANAYPGLLRSYAAFYRFDCVRTLIVPLVSCGYKIDFWGWGWKELSRALGLNVPEECLHGYLPYPDAYKVYNSADIVLGLQNVPEQVTMRTYEILGSGGFLLTTDTGGVRKLFEPGRHLAVVNSPEETLKAVEYYLDRPSLRREISLQGKQAVANHNYQQRAEYMVKVLQERGIVCKAN